MKITDSKKLKDLQDEFKSIFPYLKIEFFSSPHSLGMGSNEADILSTNLTVGEVRKNKKIGSIQLEGSMPVGVSEQLLQERFGLNVQVYRISHGKWLQTWVTDLWTLDEQNNRGKIMIDLNNNPLTI